MEVPSIPNDWDIHGVAVLVLDQSGQIIIVEERETCPETGKYAGMASIPMGAIKFGETAEAAAVREFGEETGLGVRVLYPIGFFQIQMPGRDRVGAWAFFGELTGERVPRRSNGAVSSMSPIPERDFLRLDEFWLRPLNREIYTQWWLMNCLLQAGKPIGWVRGVAMKYAPPSTLKWLARE